MNMIEKSNNKKNTGTDVVIEIKDNSGFSNIEKAPVAGWRSLINILFVTKHDDDGSKTTESPVKMFKIKEEEYSFQI